MPRSLMLLLAIIAVLATGCTMSAKPAELPGGFQLYVGNESLPPEYQRVTIIRGAIHPTKIDIVYTFRDGNGTTEHPLTIQGDDYHKYLAVIRNTRIKVVFPGQQMAGGHNFDLTLTDAHGKSTTGMPSNRRDWEQLAQEVAQAVGATFTPK